MFKPPVSRAPGEAFDAGGISLRVAVVGRSPSRCGEPRRGGLWSKKSPEPRAAGVSTQAPPPRVLAPGGTSYPFVEIWIGGGLSQAGVLPKDHSRGSPETTRWGMTSPRPAAATRLWVGGTEQTDFGPLARLTGPGSGRRRRGVPRAARGPRRPRPGAVSALWCSALGPGGAALGVSPSG